MNARRSFQVIAAAVLLAAASMHAQQTAQLKATLAKLNASSAKFSEAQATFDKDNFTKLVSDHDLQHGITYAIRKGSDVQVGIKIEGSAARTILYKKGNAQDYNPASNCFNSYSVEKNKGTVESLLALSFGASGTELDKNWVITDLGPDKITAAGKTFDVEKLDLVPKDASLKNNITHITLWTDLTTAISLKQVVYTPSGDTQTGTLSNIVYKANPSQFEIKGKSCSK